MKVFALVLIVLVFLFWPLFIAFLTTPRRSHRWWDR